MRRSLVVFALSVMTACGGSSSTAPTPTPAPVPAPIPAPIVPFSGIVTATNGGQALPGVTLASGALTTTTDANGTFSLAIGGGVSVSGPTIVPRLVFFAAPGHAGIALSVFRQDGTFDLNFYRFFARDGFEQPTALQPIRRWTRPPTIYLKTIDEAGQPVDALTLDTAAAALINTASAWSGGAFGVAGLERGTSTKEGVSGYITVKWLNPSGGQFCGTSSVGTDGGAISLNYLYQPIPGVSGSCGCNGSLMRPRTVRHELGHAMGYWHTGNAGDLMSGLSVSDCDQLPSARELAHAKYMYSRPVGNTDPDNDPASTTLSVRSAPPIVID